MGSNIVPDHMNESTSEENEKMDLFIPIHGTLSNKNDILCSKLYGERIWEDGNSIFILGSPNLQDFSKTHLQDRHLDQNLGDCSNRDDQKGPIKVYPKGPIRMSEKTQKTF